MYYKKSLRMLIILFCLLSHFVISDNATQSNLVEKYQSKGHIGQQFSYYIDYDEKLSIEDIIRLNDSAFIKGQQKILSFGFVKRPVWLRWQSKNWPGDLEELKNQLPELIIEFPIIKFIELYVVHNGQMEHLYSTGTARPFDTRPMKRSNFAFPLLYHDEVPENIYLRLYATNALLFPARIEPAALINEEQLSHSVVWGALYGLFLILCTITISFFIVSGNRYHIHYFGYTLVSGLAIGALNGHAFQYLWPNYPEINRFSLSLFVSSSLYFGFQFFINFLNARKIMPHIFRIVNLFSYFALFVAALSIFVSFDLIFVVTIIALMSGPILIFMCIAGIKEKIPGALILISAFMLYVVGGSAYILLSLKLLEPSNFLIYLKELGIVIEVVLFIVAIAYRINASLKDQKNLRLAAAKSLEERNEALEKSSQLKDNFFTMITHELRTPMNGVVGSLENVRGAQDTKSVESALSLAEESATSMAYLIDELLLYQELSAGGVNVSQKSIDFSESIRDICSSFKIRCQEKGLTFKYQPVGAIPKFLSIDAYKLLLILYKLIDNAVRFTKKGEILLQLNYQSGEPGKLMFVVQDTGSGIDDKQLEKLLQPFEQAQSGMKRPSGGLGLGLVLVKELVALLNGEFDIDSTLGSGTTIKLSCPANESDHGEKFYFDWREKKQKKMSWVAVINKTTDIPTKHAQNARVLIVEDNITNAMMLKTFIKRLGYQFDHAANGAIALELMSQQKFDIVLMDCQMPVMDGLEATRKIREKEKDEHIPILACTANTTMDDRAACTEAGMDAFIAKPISIRTIKKQIEQWLGRSK